jgi:hypothetical protein
MNGSVYLTLLTAGVLASSSSLGAQTTGRIAGQAVDPGGVAVAGVVVTVGSPSLQGARTDTTDSRGEFRFAFLPPGIYDVKTARPGFEAARIQAVRVDLDRTATVQVLLQLAAVLETVHVSGAPPAIDVTNTTTGLNVTSELYSRIPVDRSFFAIARVAPGAQDDEAGSAIYGSTGAENQYVVDGLNVTGTLAGGHGGKDLNFDFIEEVEIKTGGLPAEYGRTTGGILNVLTKSGGNDFHGSAFGFFAGGGLSSANRTAAFRPADTTTVKNTSSKGDVGADVGGRIVRDRLWLFAAYNRVAENTDTTVVRDLRSRGAPAVGAVIPGERRDNRFAGKLTWRVASSGNVTFSAFGDPNRLTGPVTAINGPPSTYLGTHDAGGGADVTMRYEGTIGSSVLVRALYGQHRQSDRLSGPGTETPRFDDLTVSPKASSGGIGTYDDSTARRDVYKIDISKFVKDHELKIGGDVEDLRGTDSAFVSGGDAVRKLSARDGTVYYGHFLYVDDRAPGFNRDDPSTWQPAQPFYSAPRTRNLSAYVQDSWQIRKGLAGDNWAPRVGIVWDVKRDGRSKLYASFSRYFESIPQVIQFTAFVGATTVQSYNFNPAAGAFAPDPATRRLSSVFGGDSTPVDPRIKGQYVDEWLLGLERELRGHVVVGVKGAWRKLGRIIEDLDAGNGDYLFGNPGEGSASTLAFFDGTSAPSPRAERTNSSFEVTARKRLSGGWQLLGSYVLSRLRGNYDGSYQRSTGQSTPNWNSGFDWADLLVNASGPLTSESVQQGKLDGSYEFAGRGAGLNLGVSLHAYSGLPENAYGLSFNYSSWQYYLAPRGTVGRNPADVGIDLHASYPIRFGKTMRLRVQADLFDSLNGQAVLSYDQRYNLFADGPCAGIPDGLCNGDGGLAARPGTLIPMGSIGDPRQTATNPDYLKKGTRFSNPRSLRLGVRYTF